MTANLICLISALIFSFGIILTKTPARTVLFLRLTGLALAISFAFLHCWWIAIAELFLGVWLIPFMFHKAMSDTQNVFFEESQIKTPTKIRLFPLAFAIFAIVSSFFVFPFFKNISQFLIKLQAPTPFFKLLIQTKSMDLLALFLAIVICIFLFLANSKKEQKDTKSTNLAKERLD